jgi:hypothetical protein
MMASDLEIRIGAQLGDLKKTLDQATAEFRKFGATAQAELNKATTKPRNPGKLLPGADGEVKNLGKELAGLRGSVEGAIGSVKALASAFIAFKAVGLFKDLIAEGVKFNSELEQAKLGIASIISAQANLVNAQGKAVTGQEALTVAIGLSEDQMKALRIAGLETSATTTQLVGAYQAALGAGIAAGLGLDDVRKIVIQTTQAAGALGVPMNQLDQEVRSILDGTIDVNSRVAKTLGITNQQVQNWKQQGTLVQELEKRMGAFAEAGKLAADNFEVIKSNAVEAFQAIAGEISSGLFDELKSALKDATSGIFDTKTLGITDAFKDLVGLAKDVTTSIGQGLGDAIRGVVAAARELNDWIKENRADIDELLASVGLILKAFGNLVSFALKLSLGIGDAGVKLGIFAKVLQTIGVLIAGVEDGFRVIAASIVGLGATILTVLIAPFEKFLSTIAAAVSVINEEAGKSLKGAADTLKSIGERGYEAAGDILKPIADGEGAVAKAIKDLDKLTAAAEAARDKTSKATDIGLDTGGKGGNFGDERGRVTGVKNKPKIPGADSNEVLKAQLERQLKELDQFYQDGLVSLNDYYDKRAKLQTAAIDAEIAAERTKRSRLRPDDENGQREAATRLALLQEKRNAVEKDNQRDRLNDQKKFNAEIAELEAKNAENVGNTAQAAAMRIDASYRDLLQRLRLAGDQAGIDLAEKIIDHDKAKAQFDQIKADFDKVLAELQAKQNEIASKRAGGEITFEDADAQKKAANDEAIAQTAALNAEMQKLAATTTDPAIKQGALEVANSFRDLGRSAQGELGKQLDRLRVSMDNIRTNFASFAIDSAVDGLADMFMSIADGSKSAGDAFKGFVRNFAMSLANMAAQALATAAIFEVISLIPGGAAILSGLSAASSVGTRAKHTGGMVGIGGAPRQVDPAVFFGAPRMHSGGMVGLKADERPAILQVGEEVLARNDPRNAANGGGQGGGGGNGVRIINNLDPSLMSDWAQSPQGEKVIINTIRRNAGMVNQSLRGG